MDTKSDRLERALYLRRMRCDQFVLDDTAAHFVIQAPDVLSEQELADVKELFAMKVRQWERRLAAINGPAAAKD